MTESTQPERFPPGTHHAFWFVTFNALSFQVVLSSPMILYAKSLGASATVLGIIAGMMPLLVIFQIPAANYVPRYGYKRFVPAGWSIRVALIFGMALVPVTETSLDATTRLALMLMLLFGFNLSRGISSCAWLPWITSLIPESIRGQYLVRDAAWVNFGSFVTFLLSALCLGGDPRAWQFAVLFAFSALMGAVSLVFLRRIPEGDTPEQIRASTAPVPWREIVSFMPFRKLLWEAMCWSIAYGGMTAFTVAYLKTEAGMSESRIMLLTSTSFLGGLSSLGLLGLHLDRLGSKPILRFALATWTLILVGWALLAGKIVAPILSIVLVLQFLMGLGAALVNMSNTRLAMVVVPVMGRSHFFAIYSVVSNLSLGLSPILWGLQIDAMKARQPFWFGFEWNRFSVFFTAVTALCVVTQALARRLEEPKAATMETLLREILIQSPQRFWLRFWPRS